MTRDYRLGIDIGGTFTDFALVDDSGGIRVEKILTTPSHPEKAVLDGIDVLLGKVQDFLGSSRDIIHATTLVTNMLLERKGARTGLITTEGFRDILEIRRESRYTLYDQFIRYPEPLVPRRLRLGVKERMSADGTVVTPLDEEDARQALRTLVAEGVEAIAVVLLHSYVNAAHEQRIRAIISEEAPDILVSLSSEVLPEPKEYERSCTTVVDAYVKAVVADYLDDLKAGVAERGYRHEPMIMLSNGGCAQMETAKRFPVQIVESGPAAGVEAASHFGRKLGLSHVLAFDMGGTTAKLCIIENGRATRTNDFEVDRVHRFKKGSGIPVAIPVYDLMEIGAGGGSMARLNSLGLLQVGPESAGASPGPACYGLGGEAATVTDADLVLGWLNPDYFLGGEMKLELEAARSAIEERVARQAGLTTEKAAAGIAEIVTETMASAARAYIADKGANPAHLTLIATGGAGPVHAVALARRIGCPRVIAPPHSGVLSSLGLLAAPVSFERAETVRVRLATLDLGDLERRFETLAGRTAEHLPDPGNASINRSLDVRYTAQDYALRIDAPADISGEDAREAIRRDFEALYKKLYGKIDSDSAIEVAAIRVEAVNPSPEPVFEKPAAGEPAMPKQTRRVYDVQSGHFADTPVYERASLARGQEISGPAVIEERESTLVIHGGDVARLDDSGCLLVEIDAAGADMGKEAMARAS